MQARDSSDSDDGNVEPANKDDAAKREKEKLLREIQELRCIIKQCEWSLQAMRFKDVEKHVTKRPVQETLEVSSHTGRMPNVDVDLQNDLYKFAGFRCVKFRRDEFIFNFTSTNTEQKNTSAVQIFIKDRKGSLGKWVMPMSIDMNYILSKSPVDELTNIATFIKNCKHSVDCYTVRQEQFLSLKKRTSNVKHCTLQSDIGFKQIVLELFGVCDNENDTYINLIIHLLYHSDKARPYKIEVDSMNKKKLSDDVKQKLKMCLKEFKISDLQIAFDKILTDNSTFTWTQEDDTESPLELNDTSNSDEESLLVQLQSERKNSLRKRQKVRELRKRWIERRKRKNIKDIKSSEDDQEDSHSEAKKSRIESQRRIPVQKNKTKTAMSVLKQGKINKNLLEADVTPVHKSKAKLKQTKLNFQTNEITNSNTKEIPLFESKRNTPDIKRLQTAKLITSTPLRANIKNTSLSSNLEMNNITLIGMRSTKKTTNKLDDSKNSDELDNTKTQERTDRLLRRSNRISGLSSQVLKRNQRLTRSMIKS